MKKLLVLFAVSFMFAASAYAYTFNPDEWTNVGIYKDQYEMWVKNKADIDKDNIPHAYLMIHFLNGLPRSTMPVGTEWVLSEAVIDCKHKILFPLSKEFYDSTLKTLLGSQGLDPRSNNVYAVYVKDDDEDHLNPAAAAYHKFCK